MIIRFKIILKSLVSLGTMKVYRRCMFRVVMVGEQQDKTVEAIQTLIVTLLQLILEVHRNAHVSLSTLGSRSFSNRVVHQAQFLLQVIHQPRNQHAIHPSSPHPHLAFTHHGLLKSQVMDLHFIRAKYQLANQRKYQPH